LPFENLDAGSGSQYVADGLTEETIAVLGQIDPEHLSVIGRHSILAFKRAEKTSAEIGRGLHADYLVEGSVRAESSRLRVTCRLVRVSDQVQTWSASYDREPASILELQRELSAAIAEEIRIRLSPARMAALAGRQARNLDAYDLYLRGRNLWNQRTPATTRRATEYYELAVTLDRDYALAWSGLADAHGTSPLNGDADPATAWPRAREAAAQAIRAQSSLAETQTSLGIVKFYLDWDWSAAEIAFRNAIALNPSYAYAHVLLGHVLSQRGLHDQARVAARLARELDPLSAMNHALSSQIAFQARDLPAAIEHAQQAVVADPEFWIGYVQRGQAYEQLGEIDLALEAFTAAARFSGNNSKAISLRGYALAKRGRANEAREVLGLLESAARSRYVPHYAMALVHGGLGEPREAFERLDRAHSDRDPHLVFLTVDPKWDPYRANPRFEALLGRCGFTRPAETTGRRG
jgi:TolB-like protein/Flp pilus assembly protein TadD